MTIWRDDVENESRVFAQSLSPENKWSAVETLRSGARIVSIKRFGSGFLAFHQVESDHAVYSNSYNAKQGWSTATLVAPLANSFGPGIATSDTAALLVGMDTNDMATAAVFNGTSWANETLAPASGGIHAAVGDRGHAAAWYTQNTAYASRYDLKLGWEAPAKLGATTTEYSGPGLEIDAAGNAFAAWPNGSNVVWRRSAHSSVGWAEPKQIEDQDPTEVVYSSVNPSSGEVMLVWRNPLGVWATRFE
jgi:hypothetical protein